MIVKLKNWLNYKTAYAVVKMLDKYGYQFHVISSLRTIVLKPERLRIQGAMLAMRCDVSELVFKIVKVK
ncbi:hypothetical protein [Labilibacter marinus]|uniref:hypothetical protein n=1 Tax=Labilibacter marinus TaxID=1477105 RepID=UPI0008311486|nr:hypothetical protein [Labilibacter marinus]